MYTRKRVTPVFCILLIFSNSMITGCVQPGQSVPTSQVDESHRIRTADLGKIELEANKVGTGSGSASVDEGPSNALLSGEITVSAEDIHFDVRNAPDLGDSVQPIAPMATVVVHVAGSNDDPSGLQFAVLKFTATQGDDGQIDVSNATGPITPSALKHFLNSDFQVAFEVLSNFDGSITIDGMSADYEAVAEPEVQSIRVNTDNSNPLVLEIEDETTTLSVFGTDRASDGSFEVLAVGIRNRSNGRWYLLSHLDSGTGHFRYFSPDEDFEAIGDSVTDLSIESSVETWAEIMNSNLGLSLTNIDDLSASTLVVKYIVDAEILSNIVGPAAQYGVDELYSYSIGGLQPDKSKVQSVSAIPVVLTAVAIGLYVIDRHPEWVCRKAEKTPMGRWVCETFTHYSPEKGSIALQGSCPFSDPPSGDCSALEEYRALHSEALFCFSGCASVECAAGCVGGRVATVGLQLCSAGCFPGQDCGRFDSGSEVTIVLPIP